jgi:hypothetical protein
MLDAIHDVRCHLRLFSLSETTSPPKRREKEPKGRRSQRFFGVVSAAFSALFGGFRIPDKIYYPISLNAQWH